MLNKKLLFLILPIITLILEILPYGAVCNFLNPEGEPWRKTYSYFDLLPFGYANFAPFITALLTCIIILLLVINLFVKKERLILTVRNILIITSLISLCPLIFGISYFSIVGGLITLTLISNALLIHFTYKKVS